MAAQLGHTDAAAEFTALATRLHASLDALFWDAQTGAYADFYVADEEEVPQTKTTTAESTASAPAASASGGEQKASSNAAASETTTATGTATGTASATATATSTTGSAASAPISSVSSPLPVKRFVRHAGYVALFPLLLRLVRASDSTRLHALLGTLIRWRAIIARVQIEGNHITLVSCRGQSYGREPIAQHD